MFTNTPSGVENWTNRVPSTYLWAHFHTLSWKMALNPFKLINVSMGCTLWNGKLNQFGHINVSMGTFFVHFGSLSSPSMFLRAHYHTLFRKMALSPFRLHQRIYGHFLGYPFLKGKLDQLGPINIATGRPIFTHYPKMWLWVTFKPINVLRASWRIPILDWESGPHGSHLRFYKHIFKCYMDPYISQIGGCVL